MYMGSGCKAQGFFGAYKGVGSIRVQGLGRGVYVLWV